MNQKKLREYQEEDIAALTKPAMCIFNEQRTGKTPTSIVAMKRRQVKHLLVVCPASIAYKWKEELMEWAGMRAVVIKSAKKFINSLDDLTADAWIINYENLRGSKDDTKVLTNILRHYKPDGLIVDEAHRCKDRSSLNHRAINYLCVIPNRLYLTGTPAPNKQAEVWSLLHYCDPGKFTSYWKFAEEFFYVGNEIVSAYKPAIRVTGDLKRHKIPEFQKLLAEYSIMRKRKDVMPWLPKEEPPTVIKLECTTLQKKYVQQLTDTFEIEDSDVECKGVLDSLIRMRQVLASPAILGLKGSSPKADWLKQYVKDYPEKSIIFFSNSKIFLGLIGAFFGEHCGLITGEVPAKKRQELVDSFQSGRLKLLGIQTQAGKEGLTLDTADVTIFLDVFPPAADYMQAKDRMVATTPERVKPKEIIHLMMQDSYDERLYQLVKNNIAQTAVINDYIHYMKGESK